MQDHGNDDQAQLQQLEDSLRQAQAALQDSRTETEHDNSARIRLSRQVDLLSHLVLMQTQHQ